ncbi:MAG TPA: AraC family transcriptional regulator [Polyangiales bacterium]|nr:AraC family transcriptional regulator [Polyangiales bacterium]
MKQDTRLFYVRIVLAAAEHIVRGMDEALDLDALAHQAALSPLHFHRIFRGMLGETPLELHRRLRLERAAWRLAHSHERVTSIAFEAGYETHESFTRAFREAFAASPSEFRDRARRSRSQCTPSPRTELAARSGVHFREPADAELRWDFAGGGADMQVEIETLPERRVAAVSHVGPYNTISEAFARLGAIVHPAGLLAHPGVAMVAICHDDPETKPAAELRADAGLVVPSGVALPEPLHELRLPAGRYARTTHAGPYDGLGDTWANFLGRWLPESGERLGNGVMFELYRNTPENAAQPDLRTDLYLSIA